MDTTEEIDHNLCTTIGRTVDLPNGTSVVYCAAHDQRMSYYGGPTALVHRRILAHQRFNGEPVPLTLAITLPVRHALLLRDMATQQGCSVEEMALRLVTENLYLEEKA